MRIIRPQGNTSWVGPQVFLFALSGLAAGSLPGAKAWAGPETTAPATRTIQLPNGRQIDLSCVQGLSDAELAAALEQAAQRLRAGTANPANQVGPAGTSPSPAEETSAEPRATPARPGQAIVTREIPGLPACGEPPAGSGVASWFGWRDRVECLPSTLLFEPPLANPWSPRMAFKSTDLRNDHLTQTIDTSIGGEFGLARYTHEAECAVQLDGFAVAMTRFSDNTDLIANDYRFGFPLTIALGPWEGKIAYEHTSTHLGDGFLKEHPGQFRQRYIRDECVLGLGYRFWDQFRAYSQLAYGGHPTNPTNDDKFARFDVGLEWSKRRTTGFCGQPFAAFDLEMRGDTNYAANMDLQVGWQWRNAGNGHSLRTALEYYQGRAPYGQFFQDREHWVGIGLFYDF